MVVDQKYTDHKVQFFISILATGQLSCYTNHDGLTNREDNYLYNVKTLWA